MQIGSKSHEILARIQGCCSIDVHARSFSSSTILIIYVKTIPNQLLRINDLRKEIMKLGNIKNEF